MEDKIKIIEEFVKSLPDGPEVAHGFDHAIRVRNWAVKIAKKQNYQKIDLVYAAALMHDISKSKQLEKDVSHGMESAVMAEAFLRQKQLFKEDDIKEICEAIHYHNGAVDRKSKLLDILRDADVLDLSGAIGIIRSVLGAPRKMVFDSKNIRGTYWGMTNIEYNKIFVAEGKVDVGPTIMDDLNFQVSCFENLKSDYARKIAKPMHKFIKSFVLEVESEAKLNMEK